MTLEEQAKIAGKMRYCTSKTMWNHFLTTMKRNILQDKLLFAFMFWSLNYRGRYTDSFGSHITEGAD